MSTPRNFKLTHYPFSSDSDQYPEGNRPAKPQGLVHCAVSSLSRPPTSPLFSSFFGRETDETFIRNARLIAPVKRVAQHQRVRGRSGAVIRRIYILRKEIPGESPAGAEIGEARGVLPWDRIHREERVFDARGIAAPVGKH